MAACGRIAELVLTSDSTHRKQSLTALPETPQAQWTALHEGLGALRSLPEGTATFCHAARHYEALRASLPPRYGEVLLGLLDRLESSALFSEESCSFSQKDLLDNIALWLEKARQQLSQAPTGSTLPPH